MLNLGSLNLNGVLEGLMDDVGTNLMGGHSIADTAGNIVSGVLSPYSSILGLVGLEGKFQKTFGQVLSNGFNITCWGSSNPPTKTKGNLETYYKPYFDVILSNLKNGDLLSINRFLSDTYVAYFQAEKMQTATKWSSCSRKGVKLYLDYMTPLKQKADELVKVLEASGSTKFMSSATANLVLNGYKVEGGENKIVSVPQFKQNIESVNSLKTIDAIVTNTEIPKISLPLAETTPKSNPILETIKTGQVSNEYMMQGGELPEVVIKPRTKPKEKESSSFPWWILIPLAMGM